MPNWNHHTPIIHLFDIYVYVKHYIDFKTITINEFHKFHDEHWETFLPKQKMYRKICNPSKWKPMFDATLLLLGTASFSIYSIEHFSEDSYISTFYALAFANQINHINDSNIIVIIACLPNIQQRIYFYRNRAFIKVSSKYINLYIHKC